MHKLAMKCRKVRWKLPCQRLYWAWRALSLSKNDFVVLAAVDLVTTFDGPRNVLFKTDPVSVDPQLGLELGYKEVIWLRGGLGQFQQVKELNADRSKRYIMQPTAGVGVRLGNFKIDYALTDVGDVSDAPYSHVISLTLNFKNKNEQ